ncbi:MAG: T9SS type A sorting domain-containing protein [Bacteroidetes bacterium]|nr:T9SS type A sorting domain-containing protein [Bacteroidota bacterium]
MHAQQGHPYDEAENTQYSELYGAVYTTYAAGKTLQEMTATQRNKVEEVAQTPYGVAYAAQAIQAHNLGKRFHRIPDSSPAPQPRINIQLEQSPRVRIYPNPTTGQITFFASENMERIVLYDLMGKIIQTWKPNHNQVLLNLAYPSGMYLLSLDLEDGAIEKLRVLIAR